MSVEQMKMNKKIHKILDYVFYALFGFVALAVTWVGVCLILGEKPNFFGYRFYVVKTDSMEPTIPVGSIILCEEKKDFSKLNTGSVITFRFSDKTNIPNTHRIVGFQYLDLKTNEESYTTIYQTQQDFYTKYNYLDFKIVGYRTQGDNPNLKIDPNPVYFADIETVYICKIAFAQYFYDFIMRPIGFIIMIAIPSLGIIVVQIFSSLRKKKADKLNKELADENRKREERIKQIEEEAIKEYLKNNHKE